MPAQPQRPVQATDVNAENAALFAGAKPAVRSTIDPEHLDALCRRYAARGVFVELVEPSPGRFPVGTMIVCASKDPERAKQLAEAEAAIKPGHSPRDINVRIGELLGYPDCCNAAFSRYANRERRWQASIWPRVARAWVPRPHPRLNVLRFVERLHLISFDPCRYDCPAAIAIADRIASACAHERPEATALLDAALARDIAINRMGVRAEVVLERRDERLQIADARFIPGCSGPVSDDQAERFVQGLLGRLVSARGWVAGSLRRARVLRFSAGAELRG